MSTNSTSKAIEKVNLIKSDVNKNNNKFWRGTLFENGDVFCEWGRVGDTGQSKLFSNAGKSFLDKKVREKTSEGRNGEIAYRKIDLIDSQVVTNVTSYTKSSEIQKIAKEQIKSNNPIVIELIERLARENAHNIMTSTGGKITYNDTTGLFATPLGIITQDIIDKANNVLIEIGDLVSKKEYNSKLSNLTNDYLMLVPSDIGRGKLDIVNFWHDLSKVQQQKQIVDSLQASFVTAISTKDTKTSDTVVSPKIFDCQLHLIEDGKEIDRIRKFYRKTRQTVHRSSDLDVKRAYTVEINFIKDAFDKVGAKMKNIWELWHGTKTSSVLSILKSGLVMPSKSSSNVTGRMFSGYPGKEGLYFSDQSTKSLNYSSGGTWGGVKTNNCMMFLADVAMGDYFVPDGPRNDLPMTKYHSTFAKGGYSGVQNNEMIVYDCAQANLTRLVEFSLGGK
jgi:poly [ADP-ribose] polymerase